MTLLAHSRMSARCDINQSCNIRYTSNILRLILQQWQPVRVHVLQLRVDIHRFLLLLVMMGELVVLVMMMLLVLMIGH